MFCKVIFKKCRVINRACILNTGKILTRNTFKKYNSHSCIFLYKMKANIHLFSNKTSEFI